MDRSMPGLPASPTPGAYLLMSVESVMPSNHLIPCRPVLLLPSILPRIRVFSSESFCIRWPSIGVSASASVHPLIFRTDFLYDGLVGSPCSPRDSQESSQTPQFKSIHSSGFSRLYGPTFTSIHACWKNQGKK